MLLLIAAVLCFLLASFASLENTELIFRAAVWGYVGLACFAAAHLPVGKWTGRE